jgi:hypothetical protein
MGGCLQFSVFTTLNQKKNAMDVLTQAASLLTTLWDTLGSNLGKGNDWPQLPFPFFSLVRQMKCQGSFLYDISYWIIH